MARRKRRAPQVYTPTTTKKITDPKPNQIQSPTQETEERNTQTAFSHGKLQELKPKVQQTEESIQESESDKSVRQITPASGEIDKQKQKWQCALIGYVFGGTPKFKEMFQFVYGVWHFVNTPRVFLHDDGYYIFQFESEEDKVCIIQNGPYTFRNRPMILKQWSPEFQLHKKAMRILPIWVCFPGLPLLYWSEENLGRIASFLGKPMCTDVLTAKGEKISYARVLIEMDITQILPESINVEVPYGGIWSQKIEYEWKPTLFQECMQVGHQKENCPKQKQGLQGFIRYPNQDKHIRQVWQPKPKAKTEETTAPTTEETHTTPSQVQFRGKQVVVFQGSKEIPQTDEESDNELDLNQFSKLCLKIGEPASRRIKGSRKGNTGKLQRDGPIAKPPP
ncbi:uncharacterized protein [Nicotiana sylvestris]|uniref:uncharacterized protein n=1 Tax=Nicotiana sylvestris TaxID=4096 RepID=UPI00388CC3A0